MSTINERSSESTGGGTIYEQVQASPEFADLRSRLRRFVFPMSAVFLILSLIHI